MGLKIKGVPQNEFTKHVQQNPGTHQLTKVQMPKDSPLKGNPQKFPHYLQSKQIVGNSVTTHKKEGNEVIANQSEEVLHPGFVVSPEDQCFVTSEGSHTINLGNYESAKIVVGLRVFCGKDDINAAYEFATDWISEKIKAEVKKIKG